MAEKVKHGNTLPCFTCHVSEHFVIIFLFQNFVIRIIIVKILKNFFFQDIILEVQAKSVSSEIRDQYVRHITSYVQLMRHDVLY